MCGTMNLHIFIVLESLIHLKPSSCVLCHEFMFLDVPALEYLSCLLSGGKTSTQYSCTLSEVITILLTCFKNATQTLAGN
jgi:hypothetical protein